MIATTMQGRLPGVWMAGPADRVLGREGCMAGDFCVILDQWEDQAALQFCLAIRNSEAMMTIDALALVVEDRPAGYMQERVLAWLHASLRRLGYDDRCLEEVRTMPRLREPAIIGDGRRRFA
jgi:hypothetical protein